MGPQLGFVSALDDAEGNTSRPSFPGAPRRGDSGSPTASRGWARVDVHTLQPPSNCRRLPDAACQRGAWAAAPRERESGAAAAAPLSAAPRRGPTAGAASDQRQLRTLGEASRDGETAAPSHLAVCPGNNRKGFAKPERLFWFGFDVRGISVSKK